MWTQGNNISFGNICVLICSYIKFFYVVIVTLGATSRNPSHICTDVNELRKLNRDFVELIKSAFS